MPNDSSRNLDVALAVQIDRVCDEFEGKLRASEGPSLSDVIDRWQKPGKDCLFRELLRVEVEYRRQRGETPERADYSDVFPEYGIEIEEVLLETIAVSKTPALPPQQAGTGSGGVTHPKTIDRYRVVRLLGRGGFGSVHLAYDPSLDREVAIKVLRADRATPDHLAEARTAARLKHPSIVAVHDVGVLEDGSGYIVMAYVEGRSLADLLKAAELDASEAVRILATVAEAIHFAHKAGFVHRDLKPDNILIGKDGCPFVCDFGLAVHEDVQRYLEPELAGTLPYMSPEQVRGEADRIDGRSDVWALGVILYEMLTRRRPFQAASTHDLCRDIQSRNPRPPRQIEDRIPLALEKICLRALEKDERQRYSSALEMSLELKAYVPTQELGTPLSDDVQFTVYRPKVVQPLEWASLLAFAHLSDLPEDAPPDAVEPIEEVRRLAKEALGDSTDEYHDVRQDSTHPIPKEGELTFAPQVAGIEFSPTSRTFQWDEEVHKEEFKLRAPSVLAGQSVRGRLSVFWGSIIVADVPIRLKIAESAAPEPVEAENEREVARRYRKIFASYSRSDAAVVRQVSTYARMVGDEFIDHRTAEARGDDTKVRALIDGADVFQLFWSTNSMYDTNVRSEWEYAIASERHDFVRPVCWQSPIPADAAAGLPPAALKELGFHEFEAFEDPSPAVEDTASMELDCLVDMSPSDTGALDIELADIEPAESELAELEEVELEEIELEVEPAQDAEEPTRERSVRPPKPLSMPDPNAGKGKKPAAGLPLPSASKSEAPAPKHNMPIPKKAKSFKPPPPRSVPKRPQPSVGNADGRGKVTGLPAPNQPQSPAAGDRTADKTPPPPAMSPRPSGTGQQERQRQEAERRQQEEIRRALEAARQEATRLAEEAQRQEAVDARRRAEERRKQEEAEAQRKRDEEHLRRREEQERLRRVELLRQAETGTEDEEDGSQYFADVEPSEVVPSDRVAWIFPEQVSAPFTPQRHCPAIDGDGRLFFTTANRLVAFLEGDGQLNLLGQYEMGGRIPGPAVVGKDGQVRVHSEDGHLHFVNHCCESSAKPVRVGQPLGHAAPLTDADGNTWINLFEGQILRVPSQPGDDPEEFTFEPERFDCTGLIREGVLYVGAENGCVYAFPLDEDGDSAWDYLAGEGKTGWFVNSAIAAGADETVIVASRDGFLYAFDRSGSRVWSVECGGQVLGAPVVDANGAVYLGLSVPRCADTVVGELLSFDSATQRIRWRLTVPAAVESTPAIGDDGTIYFGDNDGLVHAASPTGELLWSARVPAAVRSSGTIHQGKVIFGMENGQYVALRCESRTIQTGIWPKLLGNLAMTG